MSLTLAYLYIFFFFLQKITVLRVAQWHPYPFPLHIIVRLVKLGIFFYSSYFFSNKSFSKDEMENARAWFQK
jgi:hypothetical protein